PIDLGLRLRAQPTIADERQKRTRVRIQDLPERFNEQRVILDGREAGDVTDHQVVFRQTVAVAKATRARSGPESLRINAVGDDAHAVFWYTCGMDNVGRERIRYGHDDVGVTRGQPVHVAFVPGARAVQPVHRENDAGHA